MFQAIGANIVVKVVYPKTVSSVIIPESAVKFKKYDGQIQYVVESVGNTSVWKHDLKPGDHVILMRHEGKPFIQDGCEYRKVRDAHVLSKDEEKD
jgi:co-chaperonin GroES (HSP10)